MKKLIRTACVGLAAVLAALSFAGCGSEKTTSEASGKTDAKVWVVATDTTFKPFEYTDSTGAFVGIDVDILKAIAEDQGFKYELKSLGWDASIAACQAGQADGMIAGASITDKRKESGWLFSDGYYTATQCMTVRTDSDIKGFGDLSGKAVAVKTGTMGATYAESLKDQYGFTIVYFEDSPTMYTAVINGANDACVEDFSVIGWAIKNDGIKLETVGDVLNPGYYGFAVKKGTNADLIEKFNAGLKNIKDSGKYDEILSNYGYGE